MRCYACKGRGEIMAPVAINYYTAVIYDRWPQGGPVKSWVRCPACLGTGKAILVEVGGDTAA